MQMNGGFDARQFQPQQGTPAHPAGMFDAVISNTEIKPTKDGTGGIFAVEFTTPAGRIVRNYNLFNSSPQAVEIAHKELSALCHATGVFNLDYTNEGAALRNARCRIEVAPQARNPEYMEIKRVFDTQGNEPGRAPANSQPQPQGGAWGGQPQQQAQPQQQQQPPMQQAPNGNWQGQPQTQPQAQPQGQPSWGAQPNQAPANQPQTGANPAPQQGGGWQQQPAPAGGPPSSPPWGQRQ